VNEADARTLDALGEVEVTVSARVGRASVPLANVFALATGSVVSLDATPDAPAALLVNGVPIATGDLVVTEDGVLAFEIRNVSP